MGNGLIRYRWALFSIIFGFFTLLLTINEASAALPGLSATPTSQNTVYLNWTAPSPPTGKTISDYEVRFKESHETDYRTFDDGTSINTYATVTGLDKGRSYDFQVRASLSPSGKSNVGTVSVIMPKIPPTHSLDTPKISGVGFYSISITNSEKPYTQSESYTKKPNTRFEDFFPYSKFSDQIDRGKYGSTTNYGKSGQYFFTEGYATSVPTLFGEVNQPVQIQVRIIDETDVFKVGHLSLYTNVRGERSDKQFSDLYVIFDRGAPIQVFDPTHYLKEVDVQASIENDQLWIIFDFVFQKPMRKSDILLESWNEGRIPTYAKIVDAWQISEPKQLTTEIPLNAEIEITHNAASPVCKADNSCFSLFETKILTGGMVTWTNRDSFIHTITSGTPQYKDGKFGEYVYPTKSVKLTFDKPGTYQYFCQLHPWATGQISVSNVNVISSTKPVSQSTLIVKSITPAGSLLIENDDYVYLNEKSLIIEISGHVEGATHGTAVDFLLKRPDRSFEKFKIITNKEGYYKTVTVLDKKWQSGSYTIFAKHNEKIVGNISFVIMESR